MMRANLLLVAACLAISPGFAEGRAMELTPMLGFRNGASFDSDAAGSGGTSASATGTIGLDFDLLVQPEGWFEAFVDHQSLHFSGDTGSGNFDLAADYVQFGGRYEPYSDHAHGFVAASLGLTRFGANPGDVAHPIAFSGSLGGGMKIPIGKRVALRLEARGYGTFSDAAVSVNCGPGCVVRFSGSGWYQLAARAGISIRL